MAKSKPPPKAAQVVLEDLVILQVAGPNGPLAQLCRVTAVADLSTAEPILEPALMPAAVMRLNLKRAKLFEKTMKARRQMVTP